jgi:hypothetical protein
MLRTGRLNVFCAEIIANLSGAHAQPTRLLAGGRRMIEA